MRVRGWWSLAGPAHYCDVSPSSPPRLHLYAGLARVWSRTPGLMCETDRVTHSGSAPGCRAGDCNGNIYRAEARGSRMAESCQKEQTAKGMERDGAYRVEQSGSHTSSGPSSSIQCPLLIPHTPCSQTSHSLSWQSVEHHSKPAIPQDSV